VYWAGLMAGSAWLSTREGDLGSSQEPSIATGRSGRGYRRPERPETWDLLETSCPSGQRAVVIQRKGDLGRDVVLQRECSRRGARLAV